MVDVEKARRLLQVLLDNLSDLRRYAKEYDAQRIGSDRDVQHQVLHALYLTIQAGLDLALHIAADAELPTSPTYADAFLSMSRAGYLDDELARRLADWARLRNVLAHLYTAIDFTRIHAALRDDLGDWEAFAIVVAEMLEPETDSGS